MKIKKHYNGKKIQVHIGKVIFLGVFVIICIIGAILLSSIDNDSQTTNVKDSGYNQNIVKIGDIRCIPRANLETYLFMGIDAEGKTEVKTDYDGTGQCDVLMLLVIDKAANTYAVLPINRDTITEVRSLGEDGEDLGTSEIQIALAHANGDGMEQSCENTVEAVSNFLYDQKIDGYVSLNMDAIKLINNMVGGVTVTIEDDFSESDPTLKIGENIKLTDEQAMHYIHDRMNVGDGTNEARMRRQNQYLKGLKNVLIEKCEQDESYALDVFHGLEDYMVTNLKEKNVSRIAKAILKNTDLGEHQIKGTNAIDDYGFNSFIVDESSLEEVVIEMFYNKVDE